MKTPIGCIAALATAASLVALPAPARAQAVPCPGADVAPTTGNSPVMRAAVLCLMNNERIARGVPPLWGQIHLDLAAQRHSEDMVARDYFDHDAPAPAPFGTTPPERALAAGYPSAFVGENIAGAFETPRKAVTAWMKSVGHCSGILDGRSQHLGVGISAPVVTWTALFGAVSPQPATPAAIATCPATGLLTPAGVPPAPPAPAPAPVPASPPAFAPVPPAEGAPGYLTPAKLRVSRARVDRADRVLDVLAPLTSLATGEVSVEFEAAGRTTRFDAPVRDASGDLGEIRFEQRIPAAQARKGTGIVTISYPGSTATRPQEVRLRAAPNRARLSVDRIALAGRALTVSGAVSSRASGVVRVEVSYQTADGTPRTWTANTSIEDDGDWRLAGAQVPPEVAVGGGYVSVLFTGDLDVRMRGEMLSYAIAPGQTREP